MCVCFCVRGDASCVNARFYSEREVYFFVRTSRTYFVFIFSNLCAQKTPTMNDLLTKENIKQLSITQNQLLICKGQTNWMLTPSSINRAFLSLILILILLFLMILYDNPEKNPESLSQLKCKQISVFEILAISKPSEPAKSFSNIKVIFTALSVFDLKPRQKKRKEEKKQKQSKHRKWRKLLLNLKTFCYCYRWKYIMFIGLFKKAKIVYRSECSTQNLGVFAEPFGSHCFYKECYFFSSTFSILCWLIGTGFSSDKPIDIPYSLKFSRPFNFRAPRPREK